MKVGLLFIWTCLVATIYATHTLKGSLDTLLEDTTNKRLGLFDVTTTKVILTDKGHLGPIETYLRSDGSFSFPGITSGTYLLQFETISYLFDGDYRVDVYDDADEGEEIKIHKIFHGHDFNTDLGPRQSHPLSVVPVKKAQYIFEREEFSALNMLKSPMMLMSLISLVFVFVLPKMTASMDPEMIKGMQEQQQQQPNPMEKVQNFDMASYMAEKTQQPKSGASSPAKSQSKSSSKKKK